MIGQFSKSLKVFVLLAPCNISINLSFNFTWKARAARMIAAIARRMLRPTANKMGCDDDDRAVVTDVAGVAASETTN